MRKALIIILSLVSVGSNAQFIYPPNHSFEDDSVTYQLIGWESNNMDGLCSSISWDSVTIRPTDRRFMYAIHSEKSYRGGIYEGYLSSTFAMIERPMEFMFESIYHSASTSTGRFRVQVIIFGYIGSKKQIICDLDTFVGNMVNAKSDKNWAYLKFDLTKHYVGNALPDSCTIRFTCDVDSNDQIANNNLKLDNVRFTTGAISNSGPISSDQSLIYLYPNPAKNSCTVEFNSMNTQPFQLTLFDTRGCLIWEKEGISTSNGNSIIIPLAGYPKGIYTVVLDIGSEERAVKLIVN